MAEKKAKMKAGDINVTMEEETVLWIDRKRVTIFALPWSFTRYTLSPSRILIKTGFLNTKEDEIRLYRIKDISFTQSFWERLNGTGTLTIVSNDASAPVIKLRHIKNARKIKELLSQSVEVSRRENGVRVSELQGHAGSFFHEGDDHPALGPDIAPDFNGNGIDDRLEQ